VVVLPVLVSLQNGNLLVLYRSVNSGENWVQTTALHIQATNTYVLDTAHVWATDLSSGLLYRTRDGGTTWSATSPGAYHLQALSFPDARTGWGVTTNQLLQTSDGGASWQHIDYITQ
jgi:photosystem II stability/assembly factor-like uncharacterized protein